MAEAVRAPAFHHEVVLAFVLGRLPSELSSPVTRVVSEGVLPLGGAAFVDFEGVGAMLSLYFEDVGLLLLAISRLCMTTGII